MRVRVNPVPSLERPDQTQRDAAYAATIATVINTIPSVVAAPAGVMHAPVFAPYTAHAAR